jgi:hypothetical protein
MACSKAMSDTLGLGPRLSLVMGVKNDKWNERPRKMQIYLIMEIVAAPSLR